VIEDADGSERVKVVDFGIAKAFGNEEGAGEGLTKTGFVVGTPEFMSPEQLLGGSLDARSDIYALAILAYKCLTGDLPFATDTPDRGLSARLMTPARPLLAVSPDVRWPAEMQAVFDQALAREPAQRQTSAGAFARALAAAIERWQEETEAPSVPAPSVAPAPAPAPTRAEPRRPEPTRSAPPTLPSPPAEPRTTGQGTRSGVVVGVAVAALVVVAGAGYYFSRGGAEPTPVDSTAVVTPPTSSTPTGSGTPNAPPAVDTSAQPGAPPPVPNGAGSATPANTATRPPVANVPTSRPNAAVTPRVTPTSPAPTSGAVAAATRAAKQTLDSVGEAFDVTKADEAEARRVLSVVRPLLARLTTATDSTWAAIRLIEASALMDDTRGACASLRLARSTARTASQRDAVQRYDAQLNCGY